MYCPSCGQQQVPDQTKFCSRCGFQLELVSELVEHGGFLPRLSELAPAKRGFYTRKNGVTLTILWFIFFTMMLPTFFGIAGFDNAAGVAAAFGVFSSLMLLIASLAFLPSSKTKFSPPTLGPRATVEPVGLAGAHGAAALPPRQSEPASAYAAPENGWKVDTSELVRPHSVTEETTKLLQKEKKI